MQVKCPTCEAAVEWNKQSLFRPFCSKRCQLIDLGQWADEEHTIAGDAQASDTPNIDVEDIEAMLAKLNAQFDSSN